MGAGNVRRGKAIGSISAAADFLGPGAIETNKYQSEIFDLVRRRGVLGQRINQTPATGQPSRYFEEIAIPTAQATDPRVITNVATQPQRIEQVVTLKALVAQINYSIFDVEVNQQQGQFAYLEAKDLTDAVDSVLKEHDKELWIGSDTNLIIPTTLQYFGISGQILNAPTLIVGTNTAPPGYSQNLQISATGSLVDGIKTQVAKMVSRTDFEVKPSAWYSSPLFNDLIDREAKSFQLYFNETEIQPGVIVKAIPTQAGLLPLVPEPFIPVLLSSGLNSAGVTNNQYEGFVLSEEFVEYHWLTSPVPRVFQLGLLGNLAAQFTILKFGSVVAKGASYCHSHVWTVR
jgi:hypothetical protein